MCIPHLIQGKQLCSSSILIRNLLEARFSSEFNSDHYLNQTNIVQNSFDKKLLNFLIGFITLAYQQRHATRSDDESSRILAERHLEMVSRKVMFFNETGLTVKIVNCTCSKLFGQFSPVRNSRWSNSRVPHSLPPPFLPSLTQSTCVCVCVSVCV